jgi:hypothetical protein
MPWSFIESTNISFSSIETLKNTLEGRSISAPNTSLDALRNWFRDRIGSRGDFTHVGSGGTTIGASDFSQRFVYGFYAGGWSESVDNVYFDNNDGGVTFSWGWGDNWGPHFSFYLAGRGWVTANFNNNSNTGSAFHGLSGATSSVRSTDYQCYAYHRTTSSTVGFVIRIGYGGGGASLIRTNGAVTDIGGSPFFIVDKNF